MAYSLVMSIISITEDETQNEIFMKVLKLKNDKIVIDYHPRLEINFLDILRILQMRTIAFIE